MATNVTDIIKTIQNIKDVRCSQMKFLVSIANNAYKYGSLTEKQEYFYEKAIEALKETNNL